VVLRCALKFDFVYHYKLFTALYVAYEVPDVLILTLNRNHHGDSGIETLPFRHESFSGSGLGAGGIERRVGWSGGIANVVLEDQLVELVIQIQTSLVYSQK